MSGTSDSDGDTAASSDGDTAASSDGGLITDEHFGLSTIIRWSRCVIPVTVKQIHDLANNDRLMFITDGVEVNNVTIVGMVCQKEGEVGEYTLLVYDGTGQIECTRLVQEFIDAYIFAAIEIGMYVCIHGQLKGLQGKRFINIFCIRPLAHSNEVHSHFNKCIYVHSYNTSLQRGLATQPHSGMNNTSEGDQAAPPNQFMDHLSKHFSTDGISNIGQMMLDIFQQPAYLAILEHFNPNNGLTEDLKSLLDNGLP